MEERLIVTSAKEIERIVAKTVESAVRAALQDREPEEVYGLSGIMQLFGVNRSTACRYKSGILREACSQEKKGGNLKVNVKLARKLYAERKQNKRV